MTNVYTKTATPELERTELNVGLVCVAPSDNKWYRVQIVSYDAVSDSCDVKYLDYGGYSTIEAKDLRKIRTDFLKLPFQAIECYLANVVPVDSTEWSLEAGLVLQELVTQENQVISCRMLGVAEDYTPMIHLYSTDVDGNTKLLNRDLVDGGGAAWIEHSGTAVPTV
jgi:A-kinase anchor protein 1